VAGTATDAKDCSEGKGWECCPFQAAIDLLSKRHTLTIIWFLQQNGGPARFNEMRTALNVNPVSLSQRLTDLEQAGVVRRTAYKELPPRVEYDLTEKGWELVPLMDKLGEWATRHNLADPPGSTEPTAAAAST
jgi:DNA-binding HxlR family transcriptional regulator